MYIRIFNEMLKEEGKLEAAEERFESSQNPWLYLAYAASLLTKEKFFLNEVAVSDLILCMCIFLGFSNNVIQMAHLE